MKKLYAILIIAFFYQSADAQLQMNSGGQIGIGGATPSSTYGLDVSHMRKTRFQSSYNNIIIDPAGGYFGASISPSANYYCDLGDASYRWRNLWVQYINGSLYTGSDSRIKENVRPLNNAIDLLSQFNGVTYDLKKEFAYNDEVISDQNEIGKLESQRKNKHGFIAQELLKVAPELVRQDDSTGYYSVNYVEIIPILVNAVNEQQELIVKLQGDLSQMKEEARQVKMADVSLLQSSQKPYLNQNIPNPYSESTLIEYYIPTNTEKAFLYIYNMNGTQLKSYELHHKEKGEININGGELNTGMYMYTLIADGVVIDTKQMILTD